MVDKANFLGDGPAPLLRFENGFEYWLIYRPWHLREALRRREELTEHGWSGVTEARLRSLLFRSGQIEPVRGLMHGDGAGPGVETGDHAVIDWLCDQLAAGWLRIAVLPWPRGEHRPVYDFEAAVERAAVLMQSFLAQPQAPIDPTPARDPVVERHWVEIELLDEADCAVPNERYEVVLPTGRVAKGRLDRNGHARLEWSGDAGPCHISFPELDRSAVGFINSLGAL